MCVHNYVPSDSVVCGDVTGYRDGTQNYIKYICISIRVQFGLLNYEYGYVASLCLLHVAIVSISYLSDV